MRKLLLAAAVLSISAGAAFAQAGTPKGDTIVPNPPKAASSNDMSKSPGAGMPSQATHSSKKHTKKKKKH
jgi:hypothetical protein